MKRALLLLLGLFCWVLISWRSPRVNVAAVNPSSSLASSNIQKFEARGVVKELKSDRRVVVIQHEVISNYMAAMTMSFKVKDTNQLAGLERGDEIAFLLLVTPDESWIDQVRKSAPSSSRSISPSNQEADRKLETPSSSVDQANSVHPLMNYQFTNELGQPITLGGFRGQALGITFFFTRCPIPEYCPRLSRNFQEAAQKLASTPGAPTNWHFLSVSIDPRMDTPAVLRSYAARYHYDPKQWSFLTGPEDKVRELARQSGVTYEPDKGLLNHNFRTLIIDASGHLQMSFPIGGNLSDAIVTEMLKAAAVTNR